MHQAKQNDDILTSDHNQKFRVVETVRDPDGVVAVITERVSDGRISFMLTREFELAGETKRTTYLNSRHLPAVQRLITDLSERLELLEDQVRERRRDRGGK